MKRLNYLLLITFLFFVLSCNNSKKVGKNKAETMTNAPLEGIYWKLTGLIGEPIISSANNKKEAFIKFNSDGKSISGNDGCNTFGGTYEITNISQLSFGPIMSTKMYCQDIKYEQLFLEVLSKTDNFFITGDTLFLRNAKMDSTIRFIADYLKRLN